MTLPQKLLPLACLTLLHASGALAQDINNLTVYGRANVSGEKQKVGSGSRAVLVDNQSRVGMRFERALPAGMTMGATLEAGVNFTNGATNPSGLFAREASAGIGSASMGQIRVGRLPASAAYFATADFVSNHNHDTGTSADALYDGPATGKLSNAVSYTAPKIGNTVLQAQYGLRNGTGYDGTTSSPVHPMALAATTAMGPWALGLGHERGAATSTSTNSVSQTTLRAFYTMGAIGVGGYMESSSGRDNANATASNNRGDWNRKAYRLAAMYTEGKNEFHVNYGLAGKRGGVANTGATQFTLAYNHNLDKQTKLYALATRVNNEAAATYNPGRLFASPTAGQDISSVGAGLRYNF